MEPQNEYRKNVPVAEIVLVIIAIIAILCFSDYMGWTDFLKYLKPNPLWSSKT